METHELSSAHFSEPSSIPFPSHVHGILPQGQLWARASQAAEHATTQPSSSHSGRAQAAANQLAPFSPESPIFASTSRENLPYHIHLNT